jgi:hypothetical protein
MSHKTMTALFVLLCLLTALNVGGLVLNLSLPAGAAIAGMSYQDLVRDSDFTHAVRSIVQECKVNVNVAKLRCD